MVVCAECPPKPLKGFAKHKPARVFRYGQWVNMHYWTDEERAILRRDYRNDMASLHKLAHRFGVSERSTRQALTRLGVLRQAVRWTPEEEEYLMRNHGKMSVKVLAQRLHKSSNSVAAKAHRLDVLFRHKDGWFTKQEIGEILGVDQGWITRRINRGLKFEIKPHDPDKVPEKGSHAAWHISEKAFKDFLRRYPEELTGLNVDFVMLIDILAGITHER